MEAGVASFLRRGAALLQNLDDRLLVEGADSDRKVVDRPGGVPAADGQMAVLPQPQTDSRVFLVLIQHGQIEYALIKRRRARHIAHHNRDMIKRGAVESGGRRGPFRCSEDRKTPDQIPPRGGAPFVTFEQIGNDLCVANS